MVKDTVHHGFIAQELKKINPRAVQIRAKEIEGEMIDDFHSLKKDEIIVDLVAGIKALHKKIEDLEKRVFEKSVKEQKMVYRDMKIN